MTKRAAVLSSIFRHPCNAHALALVANLVAMWISIHLASVVLAATPLSNVVSFRRVEAESNKAYWLTENQGPWMIFAASFAGPGSEREAAELVLELRKRFRLAAYMHKQHYDYTQNVEGKGFTPTGERKLMRYESDGAYDEIAVLVGDYPSVDDKNLQNHLQMLKYCHPNCLNLNRNSQSTLRFAGLRALHKRLNGNENKQKKGPLGQAFTTRNPMIPQEYFQQQGLDKLVLQMNDSVEYSLLDCPGKYTVRVATFAGNVIIDQAEVQRVERTGEMESQLAEAAEKAHKLTVALRKQNVEAYEFHDRYESVVTVGSFDSYGSELPNGQIEINPTIKRVMDIYGPRQIKGLQNETMQGVGLSPKAFGGIPFDLQPEIVQVPKRSLTQTRTASRR
ncbi:MAG: hypothetical protein R3E01_15135 [Pirellulaceae bacterium]|nr:hypothetical protein [Planctomycetales bacterium]